MDGAVGKSSSGSAVARLPGAERLPIIGLVGGVASGKSFVAGELQRLGAAALDADQAGHDVLRLPEVIVAARRQWGEGILTDDGRIDRKALAKIVFAPAPEGPRQRKILEQLTHPRIGQLMVEQAARYAANDRVRALVLDAPVMMESGWDELCEHIIFIDAPPPVRLRRAMQRGWTQDDFAAREDAQETLEKKRARADFVIDNAKDPGYTRAQVQRFWHLYFDEPAEARR